MEPKKIQEIQEIPNDGQTPFVLNSLRFKQKSKKSKEFERGEGWIV